MIKLFKSLYVNLQMAVKVLKQLYPSVPIWVLWIIEILILLPIGLMTIPIHLIRGTLNNRAGEILDLYEEYGCDEELEEFTKIIE